MTSAKNLVQPAYNSNQNAWNIPVNANTQNIDDALGNASHAQNFTLTNSTGAINVTGTSWVGDYPANTASYIPLFWSVSGSMAGNTALTIPTGIGGRWLVNVGTITGAFTLTFASSGGQSVPLLGGLNDIVCDGSNVWALSSSPPGSMIAFAGAAAPSGYLLAYGQSLATASYPFLFAAIGYTFGGSGPNFNLPDLRGRVICAPDNMGGSAAGRYTGATSVGFAGGEQTHTLITGEMPVHNHAIADPGHTHVVSDPSHNHSQSPHAHGVSDPGHQHSGSANGSGAVAAGFGASVATTGSFVTNFAATGISIAGGFANINAALTGIALFNAATGIVVQNAGSGAAHNNVQPTIAINWAIKY